MRDGALSPSFIVQPFSGTATASRVGFAGTFTLASFERSARRRKRQIFNEKLREVRAPFVGVPPDEFQKTLEDAVREIRKGAIREPPTRRRPRVVRP